MGLFSRFGRSVKHGLLFNETLDALGINYRIFPTLFQKEIYDICRLVAKDDPERLEMTVKIAAKTIAAMMSPQIAERIKFYDPDNYEFVYGYFARGFQPVLERHGIAHHFQDRPLSGLGNDPD